jgi:spore germination cell wall hydrolase CwlJ-like protein
MVMSKFGKVIDDEVKHKGRILYKSFLGGMLFGALLMFILLIPSRAHASDYDETRFCMAQNIYFEAGNQPFVGKFAVGNVVMNRVNDLQFPNTVCEVVYQAKEYKISWKTGEQIPKRGMCQFSWYCDGKSDEPNRNSKQWTDAVTYARYVYTGRIAIDITEGSTHYHATYVRPSWAKTKTRTTRIESHIFYRWEK